MSMSMKMRQRTLVGACATVASNGRVESVVICASLSSASRHTAPEDAALLTPPEVRRLATRPPVRLQSAPEERVRLPGPGFLTELFARIAVPSLISLRKAWRLGRGHCDELAESAAF